MMDRRSFFLLTAAIIFSFLLLNLSAAPSAAAITVYSNDFQTGDVSGWSSSGTAIHIESTPKPVDGSRMFLGDFSNDTVTLTLTGLPAHTQGTISFDLYVIQSWDGNGPSHGPDIFDLSLGSGENLFHTTFSNYSNNKQSYPDSYPGGSYSYHYDAVEINTLGYSYYGDSVYHLTSSGDHTGDSIVFIFSVSGLQEITDESWGLDNILVEVNAVPLPGAVWLLGSGLLGLVGLRRGRKN